MGGSPATAPTPNRGYDMAALQRIGVLIKGLEETMVLVGAASEIGKDVLKAIQVLTKHIPTGTSTPASQKNTLESMLLKNGQNAQQAAMIRGQQGAPGAGAPGGGAPGAPAPGGMPQAAA